jgi:TrmH family RNA methyltransferase
LTVRLEGFHAVKHALRFAPGLVDVVETADLDRALALAARLAPDVADELRRRAVVAPVEHPTGVQAHARRPEPDGGVLTSRAAPLLLLDRPRHPANAGAAVRVAAAAGASGVAMTGALDPWHPAVLRGSAGLHYALPVLPLPDGAWPRGPLLVLDAAGDPLTDVPDDAVLAVGSERDGVGAALRTRADGVVALPMRPGVSSLNLATAASAALYAWRLRRL